MQIASSRIARRASSSDARWAAVVARDSHADGEFFYSVRTTGVYCRPSCGSRRPQRANVGFHDTAAHAEAAGFRACKRCRPRERSLDVLQAEKVAAACRLIEQADRPPTLAQLAHQAGLSSFHFHRLFKAHTGVTPKQYANADRARAVRESLTQSGSVTDAIYQAGFNSSSRFYAQAADMLGMTPTRYRQGGTQEEIRFAVGQTSLGAILVAASRVGVCAIAMGNDPDALVRDLQNRFRQATLVGADAKFEALVAQVVGAVEAPRLGLQLPLDVRGTAFQRRVWQALRKIPAGSTASYTQLAAQLGVPKAVRAVAQACAANPVAIAIPCHRVVRHDGGLSGYRWGVERKRELLKRETLR
jgi:AraC family transcriptional regulator, regulatory protein of adaptative response / methylated-DNA-[protein]-cysteine methyltransferase